jgi:hypothetical protein
MNKVRRLTEGQWRFMGGLLYFLAEVVRVFHR